MKIIQAVNYFHKKLHRRCLTELWICLEFWIYHRSEYTGVLNIPEFWICFWFWTCQGSGYTGRTRAFRIQKFLLSTIHGGRQYFPVFHGPSTLKSVSPALIYHGSKYARVTQGSEYAWICLNNSRMCLIVPECA